MTAGDQLPEVEEIERIKELKARYFRLLDERTHDEMRELFVTDARFEISTGAVFEGADAFVAYMRERSQRPERTVHHGHTPDIVLTSPSTARGTWSLSARRAEINDDGTSRSMDSVGRYDDEYRKEGGAWKIASQRLTVLSSTTRPEAS